MENYSEMYLKGKDKIVGLRLAMVKRAEEFSTKASAEYYKTTQKTVGAYLIRNMDLPFIIPTVNKYIKLLGFKQKKLSRKKKKRNLNEVKKEMKSFEKLQVDIKYLDDIPEFYR